VVMETATEAGRHALTGCGLGLPCHMYVIHRTADVSAKGKWMAAWYL